MYSQIDSFLFLDNTSGLVSHYQAGAADGPLTFCSWLVRGIVGVFMKGKRERGKVGSSLMHLLSPACQLTWWMNQFHINLMLSSYNWIIYTAQRHMGSDHFNPRWALDFCSQAIGLWPTVNILMFCWLSPANQLTPLKSNSHSIFLFGWEQKLLFQALGLLWTYDPIWANK